MYSNGTREGFKHFQKVVVALAARFGDQTIWMKLSEMARYWAAKELTAIRSEQDTLLLKAPHSPPQKFTLELAKPRDGSPQLKAERENDGAEASQRATTPANQHVVARPESHGRVFRFAEGRFHVSVLSPTSALPGQPVGLLRRLCRAARFPTAGWGFHAVGARVPPSLCLLCFGVPRPFQSTLIRVAGSAGASPASPSKEDHLGRTARRAGCSGGMDGALPSTG